MGATDRQQDFATAATSDLWGEASAVIPGGTSTNAKRLPLELADDMPGFIDHADGCRITDVRGREFIDYGASLGPIILGHNHPAVNDAVRAQLDKGVVFSMTTPLELEAARAVQDIVPGAEMVRFLKTGGDAVSACVRVARAYTDRDHIVVTGYHGWHDALASFQPGGSAVASAGVPEAVRALTLQCRHGDTEGLTRIFADHPDDVAAVVVLPYAWGADDLGIEATGRFLRSARELASAHGALLVYDEVFTGFRLAPGGGAEFFGVTPDLAAYAKAMANGFPISAFTGRAKYMQALDRARISTTYAAEAMSLAAALATIKVIREEPVHEETWRLGRDLMDGLARVIEEVGLPAKIIGIPPRFEVGFDSGDEERDHRLRSAFYSGLYRRGIFSTGAWVTYYAHTQNDIEDTVGAAMAAGKEAVDAAD